MGKREAEKALMEAIRTLTLESQIHLLTIVQGMVVAERDGAENEKRKKGKRKRD